MIGRRAFLAGGALAVLGAHGSDGRSAVVSQGRVKFCVFADIHYKPHAFPHSTKDWLKRILDHAEAEKCDFIIHCGDLCHYPHRDRDYVDFYNGFGRKIPVYHVIGNHDDDGNSHERTLEAYGMKCGHYFFDLKGFRFIVLDPNHIRYADGHVEHYSNGNYYRKQKGDVIGYVPPEQLAWLKETIASSRLPCVLFSHQSLERPAGNACSNAREVRAIVDAANAAAPGKVRMAINGHHHCDYVRVLKDVVYFDVNSASFYWMGSNYAHRHYPDEFFAKEGLKPGKVGWVSVEDPIHAIVTLDGNGPIRVEGSHSRFSCDVPPEKCGFTKDPCGRLITPCVTSFDIDLVPGR